VSVILHCLLLVVCLRMLDISLQHAYNPVVPKLYTYFATSEDCRPQSFAGRRLTSRGQYLSTGLRVAARSYFVVMPHPLRSKYVYRSHGKEQNRPRQPPNLFEVRFV
jgi:hypothetical protein